MRYALETSYNLFTEYIKTRIQNIGVLDKDIYYIDVEIPREYRWNPGQHCRIKLTINGTTISKAFSFVTTMEDRHIRFISRLSKKSLFKTILLNKKNGQCLEIGIAYGDLTLKRKDRPIMLLSNGIAIGVIRSLIASYLKDNSRVPEVIQLQVDRYSSLFKDDFEYWSKKININFNYTHNRQEFKSKLDEKLQKLLMNYDMDPYIYLVGSNTFVQETKSYLSDMGIENSSIISDGPIYMTSCGCDPENGCGCGGNLIWV